MKKYTSTKGKVYQFYDSCKEMPIVRWNAFLSYMIQDSELGPDFNSASQKVSLLSKLVEAGKMEDFNNTLSNLHLQLYYVFKGISPKIEAVAQRIHSIDGEYVKEITKEITTELADDENLLFGVLEELTEDFRKK